ncbi:MAG: AAA family ATPase [Candidatus Heimdallarchaeota archaeon]|nr:AAA family ATPase [Candidatus Heimdallarchaeota archaeon]
MKLQKLIISNFLSYGPDPIEIKFSDHTTIIGPNGVGKSNILRALRLLLQFEDYSNNAYFKELSGINNAHPNLDIRFYFDLDRSIGNCKNKPDGNFSISTASIPDRMDNDEVTLFIFSSSRINSNALLTLMRPAPCFSLVNPRSSAVFIRADFINPGL